MATSHGITHSETRISTTGTKDYTKANIGTPKASFVYSSYNTTENTDINNYGMVVGMTDVGDTDNIIMGSAYADNLSTSDARIWQSAVRIHTMAVPGGTTELSRATMNAAVTDGIQLDFVTVESTARRVSVLNLVEGIEDVDVTYVTLDGSGTVTVAPGFKADILIVWNNLSTIEPSQNEFRSGCGFYHRADNAHRWMGWAGQDGQTTPKVGCQTNDAFIIANASNSTTTPANTFNAENFTDTEYDLTNISGSFSAQVACMAIKLSTGYSAKVGHFFCPETTGIVEVVGSLGFTPQVAFLNAVNLLTQDSGTLTQCNFSIGACDADAELAVGGYMEDFTGTANTDCQGWHRADSCIYVKEDDAVLKVKASFSSFETDALKLNFGTATTGWDIIVNYLLIGKDPVIGGAPKGPLGLPFHGPFGGPL